jgi:hypothetical protein
VACLKDHIINAVTCFCAVTLFPEVVRLLCHLFCLSAGSAEADEQAVWWTSPAKGKQGRAPSKGGKTRSSREVQIAGPFTPATETLADTSYFMYRFHVRVLIPCYKEDLAVIASTVQVG